jgi:PhnB protein
MSNVKPIPEGYPRVSPHEAGAQSVAAPEMHFYGDRVGTFDDPFGYRWDVATHVEDVPPEEMEKRAAQAMAG